MREEKEDGALALDAAPSVETPRVHGEAASTPASRQPYGTNSPLSNSPNSPLVQSCDSCINCSKNGCSGVTVDIGYDWSKGCPGYYPCTNLTFSDYHPIPFLSNHIAPDSPRCYGWYTKGGRRMVRKYSHEIRNGMTLYDILEYRLYEARNELNEALAGTMFTEGLL